MFHKILSQDVAHVSANTPATKTSPSPVPPMLKRTVSWRPGHMVQTGLRSGKVNLEKMRRCKSLTEADDPYVMLESFTDFEHKIDSENPVLSSQLLHREV